MYGPEYLDWCDETRVAGLIDEFLAGLDREDRVWALAVLRKRHTVYRDGGSLGRLLGQNQLSGPSVLQTQNAFNRQRQSGSLAESIFGTLGRPFI